MSNTDVFRQIGFDQVTFPEGLEQVTTDYTEIGVKLPNRKEKDKTRLSGCCRWKREQQKKETVLGVMDHSPLRDFSKSCTVARTAMKLKTCNFCNKFDEAVFARFKVCRLTSRKLYFIPERPCDLPLAF